MTNRLRRTPQTIAYNLRQLIEATEPGAQKKTYPNGPGTKPVLVPVTNGERAKTHDKIDDMIAEWIQVDRAGAQAWINAGSDAGCDPRPERYAH